MTERLYDLDSYIKEFDATVLSCTELSGGHRVVLDRTAFFPEEGGQCCDKGYINNIEVTDVQIKDSIIYHTCAEPIEPGTRVKGVIDFDLRFRNMQNHTGEHIICGIAHRLYGYENVGFHLGESCVTMDLSGPLTREQAENLENLANEAVFKNLPVKAYYPEADKLPSIPYRCKDDIKGEVRIVEITDCDICACCAPHVASTGQVGLIKIRSCEPHRGGVRLELLCGADALRDYRARCEQCLIISKLLSVPQGEIAKGVEKLTGEMSLLKQRLSAMAKERGLSLIYNIEETDDSICIFEEGLDRETMRLMANEGVKKTKKLIGIMSGNDTDGYGYILASQTIDLKKRAKDINAALGGKGGGSAAMISGNFGKTRAEIERYLKG